MNNEPFIVEQTYNAPPEKVWRAITNSEEMKQWYFNIPDFVPEIGFEFNFVGGPDESRQYKHLCKIVEVVKGKKLAYSWRYDGYEGNSKVRFELFPEGQQTKLKLTHEGLETFPADQPDFAKANFVEGWTLIICTALKEFVEKLPINKF